MSKSLVTKLTKVLQAASKVKKSGYNSHQNYQYITESDLLEVVREELAKLNIFVFSSVDDCNSRELTREGKLSNYITTVKMTFTFVDGDTGEQMSVGAIGEGADTQDKGIFKAITGATKYFLLKNFMLSGEEDPEKDTKALKSVSGGFGKGNPSSTTKVSKNSSKSSLSTSTSKFGTNPVTVGLKTTDISKEVEVKPSFNVAKGNDGIVETVETPDEEEVIF